MKTVLIAAHQFSFSAPVHLHNSLGILYLAAALRERGLETAVPDFSSFSYLTTKEPAQILDEAARQVLDLQPDLVGMTTMVNNLPLALELCRILKEKNPGLSIVLGGQGVSFCAPEVLNRFGQIDAVIRGEADRAFADFAELLARGTKSGKIKGLVRRTGSGIEDNHWPDPVENLDDLPIPAYDVCPKVELKNKVGDYNGISIEIGRGCPYRCTFCSTCRFFKRKFRVKSVKRVIRELSYVFDLLGPHRIIFNHDLLTFNASYMEELCRELKKNFPSIKWKCHSRLDTINGALLEIMADAGCNELFIGIETGTKRMQKVIKKNLDLSRFEPLVDDLDRLGMNFSLAFIAGIPGQDRADYEAILDYALATKARCGKKVNLKIHTLAPLSGSTLYSQAQDDLVYDEYGSIGTSDIPLSWQAQRKLIKENPDLFPIYYHVKTKMRTRDTKFEIFGNVLNKLMPGSLLLAYRLLPGDFRNLILDHMDTLEVPGPSLIFAGDYRPYLTSLYRLIEGTLVEKKLPVSQYQTLAALEIAVDEVSRAKSGKVIRRVKTLHNPAHLLKALAEENGELPLEPAGDNDFTLLVFWDEKEETVKITVLAPGLLDMMSSRDK